MKFPSSFAAFMRVATLGSLVGLHAVAGAACEPANLPPQQGAFVLDFGEEQVRIPALSTGRAGLLAPGGAFLPAVASDLRSALVRANVPLAVETVGWSGRSISILVHRPPEGASHPVAAVVVDRSRQDTLVSLLRFSLPGSGDAKAYLDVARYEYLYTLAFREEGTARYCLAASARGCAGGTLLDQGEALEKLAGERECARDRLSQGMRAGLPGWELAKLQAGTVPPGDKSLVSARLADRAGPMAGARIMFSKLPHSQCTATTRADGSASCALIDAHDDGGHEDDETEPVLATFAGDLHRDPILLPTTILMRAGPPGR